LVIMARARRAAIATSVALITLATLACPDRAWADAATDAARAKVDPGDPVARARELFLEGSAKAEAGDWEAARDRFARSAKLKHAALTLYNLGIAQEETGHLLDALTSFRAFLAAPVEAATKVYVDPVRADIAKLELRLARIDVAVRPSAPASVVITVDGAAVGSPGAVAVDPGVHEVTVIAPGFGEAHQRTVLGDGARTYLTLDLQPRRVVPAPSPLIGVSLTAGGAALLVAGGVSIGVGAASRQDAGGNRQIAIGAVAGGLGAIALGAGVSLLVARAIRARQAATEAGVSRVTPLLGLGAAGVRVSF